jgi:hypothetical protein
MSNSSTNIADGLTQVTRNNSNSTSNMANVTNIQEIPVRLAKEEVDEKPHSAGWT